MKAKSKGQTPDILKSNSKSSTGESLSPVPSPQERGIVVWKAPHPIEWYVPKNLNRALAKVQTVEDAILAERGILGNSGTTGILALLCRDFGREKLGALMAVHLVQLQAFLGVKHDLDGDMIDVIVEEIISTFPLLTMADVHVIFRRARNGQYGEFYERLSMPKVMTWFRNYFDERVRTAAEMSIREAERHKSSSLGNNERMNEYYSMKEILKTIKK
jgi:hypothetical protein